MTTQTYPTAQEMAQSLIDTDARCQKAELDYQAALDHGTDDDLRTAALEMTASQESFEGARRALTKALILAPSMDDDLALYVVRSLLDGQTWMFHGDLRREHLAARAAAQAEAWVAAPFVPAVTVTETVTLIPDHTRPFPMQGVIVTLQPDGEHTVTVYGVTYRLVRHGK